MHSTRVLRDMGGQGKRFPRTPRGRKGRSTSIDYWSYYLEPPKRNWLIHTIWRSQWSGEDRIPSGEETHWRYTHTALHRECSLCPGSEAYRLVPCCACQHWVHLECSYGIPEGRLCASHCQILDPLRGVVVTDFNCGMNELRCLAPWRPWVKKYKEEWWSGSRRNRIMHEMLPNLALEKHSFLGAGLMWKRMLATYNWYPERTENRRRVVADTTPWKALPLIPVWDKLAVQTYHSEFY